MNNIEEMITRREQKKAYQIFTKEALIDMVIRKNEIIAILKAIELCRNKN